MDLPRSSSGRPRPQIPRRGLRKIHAALAVAGLAGALGAVAACVGVPGDVGFNCNVASPHHLGADGVTPDPCHCTAPGGPTEHCDCFGKDANYYQQCLADLADGGGAGGSADGPPPGCTGQCLPNPPLGWTAPVQLWFGMESGAPACPDVAPAVVYEGHADLGAIRRPTSGAAIPRRARRRPVLVVSGRWTSLASPPGALAPKPRAVAFVRSTPRSRSPVSPGRSAPLPRA